MGDDFDIEFANKMWYESQAEFVKNEIDNLE